MCVHCELVGCTEEFIVEITISGRHLEITPAIREYAEEKAGRLPKFYDLIHDVDIILDGKPSAIQREAKAFLAGGDTPERRKRKPRVPRVPPELSTSRISTPPKPDG